MAECTIRAKGKQRLIALHLELVAFVTVWVLIAQSISLGDESCVCPESRSVATTKIEKFEIADSLLEKVFESLCSDSTNTWRQFRHAQMSYLRDSLRVRGEMPRCSVFCRMKTRVYLTDVDFSSFPCKETRFRRIQVLLEEDGDIGEVTISPEPEAYKKAELRKIIACVYKPLVPSGDLEFTFPMHL